MEGLSLVIPVHNGERVIERSLREYSKLFSKKFKNFEMIAVCNDCWDNSVKICQPLTKELPLKTIVISQRGKGYALITGFNNAKYDYVGFLDADNPFNMKKVLQMLDLLENSDVVIASKYLRGRKKFQDSLIRRLLSLGGFFVSRILFNLNVRDTQAGAKFFRKKVWDKIGRNFICRGFDFDIEFLYKVKKFKFRIAELYIPFKQEKFSTFRLKYLPGMLKRLIKFRFFK